MEEAKDLSQVWNNLLPKLEKSLSRAAYETLVSSAKPLRLKDGSFTLAVENSFAKDWLTPFCVPLIEQEIKAFYPEVKEVELIIGEKDLFQTPLLETIIYSGKKSKTAPPPYLNPRYTFENFVVGPSNRFAAAAAQAVAEAPAKTYNPLFLYGGVGLGKTHLMQAVAHRVAAGNSAVKILYVTCEVFTNEVIVGIRTGKMSEFRNKYRHNDLLLVDDVQFLAGKESTQEEFFHTFSALYETSKQIIVSSDRPPKEIPTIEDRLRSRFECGLTADIMPPDFETRIAILKRKSELTQVAVADEVLTIIASKAVLNIRQLEGALIRLIAKASLSGEPITPALTEEILKGILRPEKEGMGVSLNLIKKAVSEHYGVSLDDLSAKVRTEKIVSARQVAMYLAREISQLSFPKIGEEFGGRDHTTVMHACEKIKSSLKSEPEVEKAVRSITEDLRKYLPNLQ